MAPFFLFKLFLPIFLSVELVYSSCHCWSLKDGCTAFATLETYIDVLGTEGKCMPELSLGTDVGCYACCGMQHPEQFPSKASCELNKEGIYFETQDEHNCMKHAFNNCLQRDIMKIEDVEKIKEDHYSRHAAGTAGGVGYSLGEHYWWKYYAQFVAHKTGVALQGFLWTIPEFDASHSAVFEGILNNLVRTINNDDFVCFLFNGRYSEGEEPHVTTLTKVASTQDEKEFELWYLDSNYPPGDLPVTLPKLKLFKKGASNPGIEFDPRREATAVKSFKFKTEGQSGAELQENIKSFLNYFMRDYFVKTMEPKGRIIIDVHKTDPTGGKTALEDVPAYIDPAIRSAMDILSQPLGASHESESKPASAELEYEDVFNAQQQYSNLLVDYQYDVAIEEAREKRAIHRLAGEKKKVLRSKRAVNKFQRKTYYRH